MKTFDDILDAMSVPTDSHRKDRHKPATPAAPASLTKADHTTRAARQIIDDEKRERNEVTARLRAARLARDGGTPDPDAKD